MPSRRRATLKSSFTFGSLCSRSFSAGLSSSALSSVIVERGRNQLRHLVDVGERHLEDAPDVRTTRLRLHRPERDDLRDVLAAVLPRDVLDHFTAPPLAEVDVDVGHRHALGVEEPLEDQIEVERIDIGDAEAVRYETPGSRAAARPHRDAALPAHSG